MISRIIATLILCCAWPVHAQDAVQQSFEADVIGVETRACTGAVGTCTVLHARSRDERFAGTIEVEIQPDDELGGFHHSYREGEAVIIQTQEINEQRVYVVSDRVRRVPMAWLGMLFILAVFLFGGLGALRSFLGMIVSFVVLFGWILPRILAGDSPLLIALVGSCAIMLVTFWLCHGWQAKTIAALGGTAASLAVTAVLAYGFSIYATLTGTADEEMLFLLSDYPLLDTRGILLAGIIIGSLGVLDDITISQASAVFELRRANPHMTVKELYRSAYRIGSDHIAAAVNTLILAYAGAALPLLLLVAGVSAGESWLTFLNREMIAQEIIRTFVGSIGLLAAVPLTTIIASILAVRRLLPEHHEHVPHHGHTH